RLQFPGDALVPRGVVAFREGGDDGRPVGEVLVERTERNARAFDDVAHAEGIASLLDQELLCAREDGLEALTAALLRRCASRDARGDRSRRLRRFPSCHLPSSLDARNADRKSTRLNSSHVKNSYSVFCLHNK